MAKIWYKLKDGDSGTIIGGAEVLKNGTIHEHTIEELIDDLLRKYSTRLLITDNTVLNKKISLLNFKESKIK